MKRAVRFTALLSVFLLLPVFALAEIVLEPVMQYMPAIAQVSGTSYLIVTSLGEGLNGVYHSTDLKELLPCSYANLSYLSQGFFADFQNKEEVNNKAIVTLSKGRISDYQYGVITPYSSNWVIGFVLSEATEEAYDVKQGGNFYWLERGDVFYFDSSRKTYRIGSLNNRRLVKAAAHGPYLSVQNRDESITVYNSHFQTVDWHPEKIGDAVYGMRGLTVINKVTQEMLVEGYTEVREIMLNGQLRLLAGKTMWDGTKRSSLLDLDGKVLFSIDPYPTASVTDHYAVISGPDKKQGLFDINTNQVLVSPLYDKIIANKTAIDPYVANGYVMVERDGLRGFVDTRTDTLTCDTQYGTEGLQQIGCVLFYKLEDGYRLVSADGKETKLAVDSLAGRGNGCLLIAKRDNFFGMIDWHGNEVLPFEYNRTPVITDDSIYMIRSSTGQELDRILFTAEETAE